jgi:hypothetical protein
MFLLHILSLEEVPRCPYPRFDVLAVNGTKVERAEAKQKSLIRKDRERILAKQNKDA